MVSKLIGLFDRLVEIAAMLVIATLLLFVTLGILTRAGGRPLAWTDEMSGYLMVWLSCLGWMIATRRGAHIRIRYFRDKLPPGGRRGLEAAIQAGLVAVGLVVLVGGLHLVAVNHDIEAVSIPVSAAWLYVPLVPAGFVTAAQALADMAGLAGRPPTAQDAEPTI